MIQAPGHPESQKSTSLDSVLPSARLREVFARSRLRPFARAREDAMATALGSRCPPAAGTACVVSPRLEIRRIASMSAPSAACCPQGRIASPDRGARCRSSTPSRYVLSVASRRPRSAPVQFEIGCASVFKRRAAPSPSRGTTLASRSWWGARRARGARAPDRGGRAPGRIGAQRESAGVSTGRAPRAVDRARGRGARRARICSCTARNAPIERPRALHAS